MDRGLDRYPLIVIDVQKGFDDASWGPRNNPAAEENISRLIAEWRERRRPLVFVRHDSVLETSPLRPGQDGNDFKDVVTGEPDLLITKQTNSVFYGRPDLDGWLKERGAPGFVVCGIQTNYCAETTARMGGNLGYDVLFALDATYTFDGLTPGGEVIAADVLAKVTAANLQPEFATVVNTGELLGIHTST